MWIAVASCAGGQRSRSLGGGGEANLRDRWNDECVPRGKGRREVNCWGASAQVYDQQELAQGEEEEEVGPAGVTGVPEEKSVLVRGGRC